LLTMARLVRTLFGLGLLGAANGMELTKDNFETSLSGKNAIVKFQAPW